MTLRQNAALTQKTFTIGDIRKWNACYDPAKYLPEGWKGDAIDILRIDACPVRDRFWVVFREACIDARTLRLFAVWCAREALKHVKNPDARIIEACDVAERYANGEANRDELNAAYAAAYSADSAARAAADSAYAAAESAYAAARAAAAQARAAAESAYAAAYAAAEAAAESAAHAAYAAASSAAYSASLAADSARAASDSARAAQVAHLIEIIYPS